jgi:hypothetical protein
MTAAMLLFPLLVPLQVVFCSTECAVSRFGSAHRLACPAFTLLMNMSRNPDHVGGLLNEVFSRCCVAVHWLPLNTLPQWHALASKVIEEDKNSSSGRVCRKSWTVQELAEMSSDPSELLFRIARRILVMAPANPVQQYADYHVGHFALQVIKKHLYPDQTLSPQVEAFFGAFLSVNLKLFLSFSTQIYDCVLPFDRKTWLPGLVETAGNVYPTYASFFPRSCDPNVFEVAFGDVLVVRARRPIRAGEVIDR